MKDSQVLPERGLLYGIVDRAFRDATGKVGRQARRDAYAWIESNDREEWSFIWVCQHLNLDPINVRRGLARYVEERRKNPLRSEMKPDHFNAIGRFCDFDGGDDCTISLPTREYAG